MKLSSLTLICLLFGLSGYANAICNTKLKKGDHYEQLNTILQCQSSKIQALEEWKITQIQELEKLQAKQEAKSSLVPEIATSPSGRKYSDDTFDVTLKSCVKNRNKIQCILRYENISDTNIRLYIKKSSQLSDNNGELWTYTKGTAINHNNWTTILKKTHVTTKITFEAQGNLEEKVFNLYLVHELPSGIPNVRITFNDLSIENAP